MAGLYKPSLLQSKDWPAWNRHYVSPTFWQDAPTIGARNTGLNPDEMLALRVSSIREHLRNKRPKTDGRRQITRANLCPTTVGWKRSPWSFRRPIVAPSSHHRTLNMKRDRGKRAPARDRERKTRFDGEWAADRWKFNCLASERGYCLQTPPRARCRA